MVVGVCLQRRVLVGRCVYVRVFVRSLDRYRDRVAAKHLCGRGFGIMKRLGIDEIVWL